MSHSTRIISADMGKGFILAAIAALSGYYPSILSNWVNAVEMQPLLNIFTGLTFGFFFFFYGLTIPFYVSKKINKGNASYDILKIIFARTLILLVVGILLANISRVNSRLTGIPAPLWSFLLIAAIFLVWNRYPEKDNNFFTVSGLRVVGLAVLVFLVLKFRSGSWENDGSLVPGYWELPGLAGWGFLISSLSWLALRNSLTGTFILWSFFFSLNILAGLEMNRYLDPVRPFIGVIIDGYIPVLVLSGHLAGIIVKRHSLSEIKKLLLPALLIAVIIIIAGIFLLRFFPIGNSFGNPAFALLISGSASLFFLLMFLKYDIKNKPISLNMFRITGQSFFTAYMIYLVISAIIKTTGADSLIYTDSTSSLLRMAAAIFVSLTIVILTYLLHKAGIKLKF